MTRGGKEKSVQDQQVAHNGRGPGLTGGDSLLVRGGSEEMSEKHDQTNGEEKKKMSGELDAAQKSGGMNKAESGEEVKADREAEADGAKEPAKGNDTKDEDSETATMTEAAQRELVNKMLGRGSEMAGSRDFKMSAADLIRLIQFQKEMTAKPHKVTVQWVEDERE